jgi:acyl-CoA thioester hydrolase
LVSAFSIQHSAFPHSSHLRCLCDLLFKVPICAFLWQQAFLWSVVCPLQPPVSSLIGSLSLPAGRVFGELVRMAKPLMQDSAPPILFEHVTSLRVRYSETDQMGTFYNSRALEWFECGRTELLRAMRLPYTELEARGLFLPLVEAHVEFQGRARYDDLLRLNTSLQLSGRARARLEVRIVHAESGRPVACGYTVHAFTGSAGKPVRPPEWFLSAVAKAQTGRVPLRGGSQSIAFS